MGEIETYKNESGGVFSQIKLDNGERILISVASLEEPALKIFKLNFLKLPTKTVFSATLEEMVDLFADPEHYGEPILDKIIEKIVNSRSMDDIVDKIEELKNSKKK